MTANNLTQQLEEAIELSRPKLIEAAKARIAEAFTSQLDYTLDYEVKQRIAKELVDAVTPMIKTVVEENKSALEEAVMQGIKGVAVELAEQMRAHAAKNLANSWTMKEVVGKMFG